MFSKIEVNGKNTHSVYKFLRSNSPLKGSDISWNFSKFLVNKKGEVVSYHEIEELPKSLTRDIEKML